MDPVDNYCIKCLEFFEPDDAQYAAGDGPMCEFCWNEFLKKEEERANDTQGSSS